MQSANIMALLPNSSHDLETFLLRPSVCERKIACINGNRVQNCVKVN